MKVDGTMKPGYRPDIDGLRALAVLAVLFYHVGFNGFTGGFVGVDVFFVISGYLITGILKRSVESGTFSFSTFYLRRFRRLFPAIFATVAVSFAFAFFLLPPPDMEKFGGSSVASLFSVANIYFWSGSGYFDSDAISKPLLHLWSLGVEEQFYLVWPLFVIGLVWFAARRALLVIGVAGLVSLAAAQLMVMIDQPTAFFWMPFRVFEFCIGAALAWTGARADPARRMSEVLLLTGYALIVCSVVFFDHSAEIPGISALAPCVGAALVIFAGESRYSGIPLRSRPMVWVGLMSYSIYLVHWPIIVFFHYYSPDPFTYPEMLGLLAASLAVGFLLWRFVEQPFRYGWATTLNWKTSTALSGLSVALLVVPSVSAWSSSGWDWRLPEELRLSIEQMQAQRSEYWGNAWSDEDRFADDERLKVYVLGNSYAVDSYYALRKLDGIQVTMDGSTRVKCYAFQNRLKPEDRFDCEKRFRSLLSTDNAKAADVIVLHERWRINLGLDHYLEKLQASLDLVREANPAAGVVIVGPRATYKGKMVYHRILDYGRLQNVNQHLANHYYFSIPELRAFDEGLREFAGRNNAGYISVIDHMCEQDICEVITPDGSMVYWDRGHWTQEGAEYFAEKLKHSGAAAVAFRPVSDEKGLAP